MKLLNDFFHIEKCEIVGKTIVYTIILNSDHAIYKAHFPKNPVTPGVCLVQIASECLEQKVGRKLYIKDVKNIKFLTILSPLEINRVDIIFTKIIEGETECTAQTVISAEDVQYAKLSIVYVYESF